jgi:hypothetical protein
MRKLLPIILVLCLLSGATLTTAQHRPPMAREPIFDPMPPDLPTCHTELLCVCGWEGKWFTCTLYEVTVCD